MEGRSSQLLAVGLVCLPLNHLDIVGKKTMDQDFGFYSVRPFLYPENKYLSVIVKALHSAYKKRNSKSNLFVK